MRGNNGNAFRLARDGKEPLVAHRIVTADGGKVLELITDKERRPIVPIWFGFHPRYAELDGALVVDLHHCPNGLGQRRIESYGEIEADDLASFDQLIKRWQDAPVWIRFNRLSFVQLFRRTEDPVHIRVGFEEREEYGDALDDRGLDLGAKELPVFPIPVIDALELQAPPGIVPLREVDRRSDGRLHLQDLLQIF